MTLVVGATVRLRSDRSYVRSSNRFAVHLQVRYQSARAFVQEYAENLSAGGLFIGGAGDLEPLQEVAVEIELPGAGVFRVVAQVAHVMDAATAARMGRSPGAGLAIIKSPPGFSEALSAYLARLGRRADHLVLCGHDGIAGVLAEAGYRVATAPPPADLVRAIAGSQLPVVGVVVAGERAAAYRAAAAGAGAPDLVHVMDSAAEVDRLLARLDDAL
jgi:hypothetical protein